MGESWKAQVGQTGFGRVSEETWQEGWGLESGKSREGLRWIRWKILESPDSEGLRGGSPWSPESPQVAQMGIGEGLRIIHVGLGKRLMEGHVSQAGSAESPRMLGEGF
jgi:hypothetical protein